MKRILTSLFFLLAVCFTASAQIDENFDNIEDLQDAIADATFTPGEEATISFDYFTDGTGFYVVAIFGSGSATGLSWDGSEAAVNSWSPLVTLNDTELATENTGDITFTVPNGLPLSADGTVGLQLQLRNSAGDELASVYSVTTVAAPSVFGTFDEVTFESQNVAAGTSLEITINYSNGYSATDAESELKAQLFVTNLDNTLFDFDIEYNGIEYGNNFESQGVLETGDDQEITISYLIPSSYLLSEELGEEEFFKISLDAFGINYRDSIYISEPTAIVEVSNITIDEDDNSAIIGNSFGLNFDYTSSYEDDVTVEVALVVADSETGEFITYPAGSVIGGNTTNAEGWYTAGFDTEALSLATSIVPTTESYLIDIPVGEAVASEDLPEGTEWRVLIRGAESEFDDRSTVVTILASEDVQNQVNVVSSGYSAMLASDSTTVVIGYETDSEAVIEVAVQLYVDAFTGKTVGTSDSVVTYSQRYIVELEPTTVDGDTVTVKIGVPSDIPLSSTLESGESYMIVAKLLHGTAETNAYVTQDNSPTSIDIVDADSDVIAVKSKVERGSFETFPNPVNDVVNFTEEVTNVVVFDAVGTVVYTAESALSIDFSALDSGVYMINTDQGFTRVIVE